jgi:hypothetical protein
VGYVGEYASRMKVKTNFKQMVLVDKLLYNKLNSSPSTLKPDIHVHQTSSLNPFPPNPHHTPPTINSSNPLLLIPNPLFLSPYPPQNPKTPKPQNPEFMKYVQSLLKY